MRRQIYFYKIHRVYNTHRVLSDSYQLDRLNCCIFLNKFLFTEDNKFKSFDTLSSIGLRLRRNVRCLAIKAEQDWPFCPFKLHCIYKMCYCFQTSAATTDSGSTFPMSWCSDLRSAWKLSQERNGVISEYRALKKIRTLCFAYIVKVTEEQKLSYAVSHLPVFSFGPRLNFKN